VREPEIEDVIARMYGEAERADAAVARVG
jgi:ABC-2 type transport system ATP-binding protein